MSRLNLRSICLFFLLAAPLAAFDKNGVAPRAISLPSGPGSIQGLGESFQPQLNTGTGTYDVPLVLPKGPGGQTPALALVYNSGARNGLLGIGWSLSGLPSIRRSTNRGVPLYVDGPNDLDDDLDGIIDNPQEIDTFTGANQEELVPLDDGTFRAENEGAFWRYARLGDGWEARAPDGRQLLFGQSAGARVESDGKVFEWCLERQLDPNSNAIDYQYMEDPANPARKHLRRVLWGQAEAYFAAVLLYQAGRPDVSANYQAGFDLRISVRLSGVDVISHGLPAPGFALRADLDGDGNLDALIRRYRLEYDPNSHLSLLTRITQLGADGTTAIPTLTLTYSQWTPPDDVAAGIVKSSGAPAEGLDSHSVELIDMNGDGLPDLLSTSANQHRVYLNRGVDAGGRLQWGPGQPVGNAPTIDLASDRTHLADATADGAADLLVKITNTSFLCYDNTSEISWTGSPFPIRNTDTWPIWPYDGDAGKLSRSFDADYSRSNDILHTSETGNQLWLLLSGGRFSKEIRLPALSYQGQVFRFDLPGTHIADLNGDRLLDLVWIQPGQVICFLSRGRGDFDPPLAFDLGRTLTIDEINRGDFSDVDGDGLEDLTIVRPAFLPTGVAYWLNRFDHLEGPRTLTGLPAIQAGDALRWADMNGNGTTDIVISQGVSAPGEKILFVDLVAEGKIHLLKRIENGLGLTIDLAYESSTLQMVRADAAGAPWSSHMPIHVQVVSAVSESDGRGTVNRQTIAYRDPYYDTVKQEFRGFGTAEVTEAGDGSAAGRVSRHDFDTGRESSCKKGKLLAEELRGEDGTLFRRTEHSIGQRVLAQGLDGRQVCFAFEEAADDFVHEGEPTGVRIRRETDYDDFGNVVAERRSGVVDRPGDEVLIERAYDVRTDTWFINLLERETVLDATGNRLSEVRHRYDSKGNLVDTDSWLDTEDRLVLAALQDYDGFGNLIRVTDARGNRREIAYDAALHAFPVLETIHLAGLDLVESAEYDPGFGVVTAAVDFSGEATSYEHDPLGRLVKATLPGGAAEEYQYTFGNPVSRTDKKVKVDAGGATFDSHIFSDGYGRGLGVKVAAEGGRWRYMKATSYNNRKLEAGAWLPVLRDSPDYETPDPAWPHEERTFDTAGRPLDVRRADGSTTRREYHPLETAVFDGDDLASGGSPNLERVDGQGRLVEVVERNGPDSYTTRYTWNERGELTAITDALENTRSFVHDSHHRLRQVDDPDRGRWTYEYDDVGNRIRRQDSKGQVVIYEHDEANRTLRRVYREAGPGGADVVEATYHYDRPAGPLDFGDGSSGTARNVTGRLSWVEDPSGEEHFSYDERGNIEWVLKRIRDAQTGLVVPYRVQRSYDLLNRETEMVFPDNDRVRWVRGAGAFVQRVDGGASGGVVLAGADFAASGQPLSLRFGNGVESTFQYDAGQRVTAIRVRGSGGGDLLNETLAYDASSNVTAIDDLRLVSEVPADSPRRRTARFTYDELNRLVRASYGEGGGGGRVDYAYDPLGNLLHQSTPPSGQPGHLGDAAVDLGDLAYAGGRSGRAGRGAGDPPGPHAVTATSNGHRFDYDANGHIAGLEGAQLGWNFEGRLVRYAGAGVEAAYVHDHSGRRVSKRVDRGGAVEETVYVDEAFEVRGGAPAKYALLDGRRLARIGGMLDPSREPIQRLVLAAGWNLTAAAVTSPLTLGQAFGADAAVYEARDGTYSPLNLGAAVPAGKALWVFAPSARQAALKGPPIPGAAGPEPGPLHAWSRLEPFRPAEHLDGPAPVLVFDAKVRRWLRRDPSLPSFLSDAPAELGAAQAFWSPDPVTFRLPAGPDATIYYHQDHLGSPAVITDVAGALLEERGHYPYGAVRSSFGPRSPGGVDHDFTDKERDAESGLVSMGARGYLDLAGVFLSPDPRYAEAPALGFGSESDQKSLAAFLSNPQTANPYAYAARNPLKFVDPTGLDVVFSKGLRDSPAFREALDVFKGTQEGKRILARIEKENIKVTVGAGKVFAVNPKNNKLERIFGQTHASPDRTKFDITVDLGHHQDKTKTHDELILEIADTIHHEFRHVEGEINKKGGVAQAREVLDTLDDFMKQHGMPTTPTDPLFRKGNEVHTPLDAGHRPNDDPLQQKFREQAAQVIKDQKD